MPLARTLSVAGEVEQPLALTLDELRALAATDAVVDFHCHEGWSRPGQRFRGVALRALLARAGARPDGRWVTVRSGGYTVVLERRQAEDERVLLALELDGEPLAAPRLVGPSEWDCFLSVKAVDRVELTRVPQEATGPTIALARIGRPGPARGQ